MKNPARICFVVIGDLEGSRRHARRAQLQQRLTGALSNVNAAVPAVQHLQVTLGDEFQGVYDTLVSACDAALQVRLELLDAIQVRIGIGHGEISVRPGDAAMFGQDGPAWWAARDSLDRLKKLGSGRQWPAGWRTSITSADGHADALVNALLICRDQVLAGFDARDAQVLLGLVRGQSQATIARRIKITQSAVAQRQKSNGSYAVLRAHEQLREAAPWHS